MIAQREGRLLAEAQRLATIYGAAPQQNVVGDLWRISDTSHRSFGELVPAQVLSNQDLFVIRGEVALVSLDNVWTTASKEASSGTTREEFERKYQSGPGRDKRLMGDERDPDGRRFLSLAAATPLLAEAPISYWPISGPRSVREFLLAVRSAGHPALPDYHN